MGTEARLAQTGVLIVGVHHGFDLGLSLDAEATSANAAKPADGSNDATPRVRVLGFELGHNPHFVGDDADLAISRLGKSSSAIRVNVCLVS
jgi:hypothetical protein